MPLDALSAALLALVQSGEGIPFTVKVSPADDVLALRKEIEDLRGEVKFWREKLERCEYLFAAECQVTQRLIELLQDHDIRIPRGTFKR